MKRLTLCATLLLAATLGANAQEQGQNGPFCLVTKDGAQNCGFTNLAQCEEARRGATSGPCFPNPQSPAYNRSRSGGSTQPR